MFSIYLLGFVFHRPWRDQCLNANGGCNDQNVSWKIFYKSFCLKMWTVKCLNVNFLGIGRRKRERRRRVDSVWHDFGKWHLDLGRGEVKWDPAFTTVWVGLGSVSKNFGFWVRLGSRLAIFWLKSSFPGFWFRLGWVDVKLNWVGLGWWKKWTKCRIWGEWRNLCLKAWRLPRGSGWFGFFIGFLIWKFGKSRKKLKIWGLEIQLI